MTNEPRSIHQIRKMRYNDLKMEFSQLPQEKGRPLRGQLERFGAFTSISPRYLSHIENDRKNIGEETARKLENAFNKPQFWLDTEPRSDQLSNAGETIIKELACQAWRKNPLGTHAALLTIITAQ